MILLSTSPCVAVLRSSERTLGARFPEGATRRAPNDAAPTEPAPVDPYRGAVTAPAKNTYVTFLWLFIRKSRWKDFAVFWHTLLFEYKQLCEVCEIVWRHPLNQVYFLNWLLMPSIHLLGVWVISLSDKKCSVVLLGDFPDVG